MKTLFTTLALLMIAMPAFAQLTPEPTINYTLAVYASTATDPNTSPHVGTDVVYPVAIVQCGLTPKATPPASINNPTHSRFDDPADATKDCEVNMLTQVAALPVANGYKAAIKANGATTSSLYSGFSSNSFNRVPVAPPLVTGVRITP